MKVDSRLKFFKFLHKQMLWFGIINFIIGAKLIISYIIPGLRTPGELILSGIILIIYSVKIWNVRSKLKEVT